MCLSPYLQQHLQLASEVPIATARNSSNKNNDNDAQASQDNLTTLRCLNCSTVLLTYPAAPTSSPMQPVSTELHQDQHGSSSSSIFYIDRSNSSKLIIGSKSIQELSDKSKNPDWSDLFRLVVPLGGNTSSRRSIDEDKFNTMAATPSSPSSASSSTKMKRTNSTGSGSSSNSSSHHATTKRHSSSSSHTQGTTAPLSPFQITARARIKQNRQTLEKDIQNMRDQFDVDAKRYLDQADSLTSRLRSASRAAAAKQRRTLSPSTKRTGSKLEDRNANNKDIDEDADDDNGFQSSTVIIKGGFDGPPSKATSPTRSQSIASTFISSTANQPITSPYLASSGNYPSLFSTLSGISASGHSNSNSGQFADEERDSTSRETEQRNGIVQPTAPQSPTFRRSRSPSPSRDSSKTTVSQSREQSRSRSTETPSRQAPFNNQKDVTAVPMFGSSYKRPALNLDRDVSQLETERAVREDEENGRGRTGSSSSNAAAVRQDRTKSSTVAPPVLSSSHVTRQLPAKPGGAWLRLNGLSPSPPKASTSSVEPRDGASRSPSKFADPEDDASAEHGLPSHRPNVHRDRHVSFKDPEEEEFDIKASVLLQIPAIEEEYAGEETEVPFDMDEDIVHSEEEDADSADEDEDATPSEVTVGEESNASALPSRSSVSPSSKSATPSRAASDSLSAVLKDPSSFIGSLRSRNLGEYSGNINVEQASSARRSGKAALSPDERANLGIQAQRLRDLLALDAPSHRGGKNRNRGNVTALLHGNGADGDEDIADHELDDLAPVSMATSLPISIGIPRFNRKEEFDFERKTSVPQKESMLVPRLAHSKKERTFVGALRLPALGEESESPVTSRATSPTGAVPISAGMSAQAETPGADQHSPPIPAQRDVSAREDVGVAIAARDEEAEEAKDQVKDLRSLDQFVPPHVSQYADIIW